MKPLVSASVMCADQLNLEHDILELQQAGVDYLHLDVMDGNYVPNITLGIDTCKTIKHMAVVPIDIHLLVLHPEQLVSSFEFGEGDIVSAHFDCIGDVERLSASIHGRGARLGIVLNPVDAVEDVFPLLPMADLVSLMMIEPGFAGRKMVDGSLEKITHVREFLDENGLHDMPIEIDGNVSLDHAPVMRRNGGDVFVAGTSSLFRADRSITECLADLREALNACDNSSC